MLNTKALLLATIAVFAPIKAIMLVAFAMIVADLITGTLAAHKRGEKINSKGFKQTVIKTAVYQVAIIFGFLCETYLTGSMMPVSKIITSYIGFTEMLSILENLNSISGGSLLKALIKKLGAKSHEA